MVRIGIGLASLPQPIQQTHARAPLNATRRRHEAFRQCFFCPASSPGEATVLLLPSEVFVHPPELPAADPQPALVVDSSSPQRRVLHTRPRTEKSLARRLMARSVGFVLPQYERRWLSRRPAAPEARGRRRPGGDHGGGAGGLARAGDALRQELQVRGQGPLPAAGRLHRGRALDDLAAPRKRGPRRNSLAIGNQRRDADVQRGSAA